MVRAGGLEPPRAFTQRIFLPATAFAAPPVRWKAPSAGLRSGLSLHHTEDVIQGLGAARLVSTPSRSVAPGLARDCHVTGFPEFGQFCIASFPASTQVDSSPLRLPFRHARVATAENKVKSYGCQVEFAKMAVCARHTNQKPQSGVRGGSRRMGIPFVVASGASLYGGDAASVWPSPAARRSGNREADLTRRFRVDCRGPALGAQDASALRASAS